MRPLKLSFSDFVEEATRTKPKLVHLLNQKPELMRTLIPENEMLKLTNWGIKVYRKELNSMSDSG